MGLPILISDYRERKILKRFKVTPISPTMILFVHLMIYTIYSAVSVVLLWVFAKLFWNFGMRGSYITFFIGWLVVLMSIFSIGILVGGIARNSKTASVIASVMYFPMLVFSGATVPYEIMPVQVQKVTNIMPLTQGIKILKAATLGTEINNVLIPIIIMVLITIICAGMAIKFFRWE